MPTRYANMLAYMLTLPRGHRIDGRRLTGCERLLRAYGRVPRRVTRGDHQRRASEEEDPRERAGLRLGHGRPWQAGVFSCDLMRLFVLYIYIYIFRFKLPPRRTPPLSVVCRSLLVTSSWIYLSLVESPKSLLPWSLRNCKLIF